MNDYKIVTNTNLGITDLSEEADSQKQNLQIMSVPADNPKRRFHTQIHSYYEDALGHPV